MIVNQRSAFAGNKAGCLGRMKKTLAASNIGISGASLADTAGDFHTADIYRI